jgi:membrane-associated phospholipid phosphatase
VGIVLSSLRPLALAAGLAAGSTVVAVSVAAALDLPLRDPDGIAGPAYVRLPGILLLFVLADLVPRLVARRTVDARAVLRERWTRDRVLVVAVGLASFYATYVSYRNLKGALPFARPEVLDPALLELDRDLVLGQEPSTVLHDLLGTGVAAHLLSFVYLLFLAFVPLSLAAALVWGRSTRIGAWYVTALCLNWLLGTASYYLVPSLGPVFVQPGLYADLPETGVSALQRSLAGSRSEVLADPTGADTISGIAGFASLHCSIVFTAALIAHLVGLHVAVRIAMWLFLALTMLATAYFGWHYLVDDVAGLAIGAASVAVAAWATRERAHHPERPGQLLPEPA